MRFACQLVRWTSEWRNKIFLINGVGGWRHKPRTLCNDDDIKWTLTLCNSYDGLTLRLREPVRLTLSFLLLIIFKVNLHVHSSAPHRQLHSLLCPTCLNTQPFSDRSSPHKQNHSICWLLPQSWHWLRLYLKDKSKCRTWNVNNSAYMPYTHIAILNLELVQIVTYFCCPLFFIIVVH